VLIRQHVTAQQGARVGILSPAGSASTKVFDAFCAGLRDLGYWQRPHAPIVGSKGPLSKPTTATVSWPRERLFMPRRRPCPLVEKLAGVGGFLPFIRYH
jgi:hypothetical protein